MNGETVNIQPDPIQPTPEQVEVVAALEVPKEETVEEKIVESSEDLLKKLLTKLCYI